MSLRVDSASVVPGALVVGVRGLGVRGDAIPSSGTHGPSFMYDDITLPGDAAKEYRAEITAWPAGGTLTAYEDGSFEYAGTTSSFTYQLYEDGVALGSPQTVTLNMTAVAGNAAGALDGVSVSAFAGSASVAAFASGVLDAVAVAAPMGTATGASAGAPALFSDDFAGVAGSLIDGRAGWVNATGLEVTAAGRACALAGVQTGEAWWDGSAFDSRPYKVSLDITGTGAPAFNEECGIRFWRFGEGSFYQVTTTRSASEQIAGAVVMLFEDGAGTTLANIPLSPRASVALRVEVSYAAGQMTAVIKADGVTIHTLNEFTAPALTPDVGLTAYKGDPFAAAALHLDNFRVEGASAGVAGNASGLLDAVAVTPFSGSAGGAVAGNATGTFDGVSVTPFAGVAAGSSSVATTGALAQVAVSAFAGSASGVQVFGGSASGAMKPAITTPFEAKQGVMASVSEQILARALVVLTGATPAGTRVFRSREDALAAEELPAVVLGLGELKRAVLASGLDRCDQDLRIGIFAAGQPWDAAADLIAEAASAVLRTDAQLAAIGSGPRLLGTEREAEAADGMPGRLELLYRFTWAARA